MHQRPLRSNALRAAGSAGCFTALTLLVLRWWAWTSWSDALLVLVAVALSWFVVDLTVRVLRRRAQPFDQR